ncbi:TniB family NTP-binding protein [Falsigemmobacter faecalis]|uniref:Transposase n=1 Tax=Falsigemmobacter faecalis TaxID=2488730 RepID=A0A3P3DCT2_9RHOB|nr:TniB family NTP-binding protein [Falsigemmobacter faecalis]RRH70238.1 hypothetical protein EG244_17250 [Falsigemmobacter faecalis]
MPILMSEALDVRIRHRIYSEILMALRDQLSRAANLNGAIIPLLGPTRVGKSDLLLDLVDEDTGFAPRASASLLRRQPIVLGAVPPKPNERELYRAMLLAMGFDCGKKERTSIVRDRVIAAISREGVAVLVLDECNHCVEPGANLSARSAADHFKTIVDATGITLVLAGLPNFQRIVDGNEQFRDRAMRSLIFEPYSWSLERDREGFVAAMNGIFALLREASVETDFADQDIARRLFAVCGGRVGLALRILKAVGAGKPVSKLTMQEIAAAAAACCQDRHMVSAAFSSPPPGDDVLSRSYVNVMQEAGLSVLPNNVHEYAAVRGLRA